jgi:hypothetical protein
MERALHPELAKRIVTTYPQHGRSNLGQQGAMTLLQNTRNGGGKNTLPSQMQKDVVIHIYQGAGHLFLDARLSPHQNVCVMGRLIAIVIALAILAFAEIRYDAQAPTAQRQRDAVSGQLADPPAPEPDVPAIITASVSTSATVQTVLLVESRRQLSPAVSVFIVSRHLPVVAHSTGKPRFFPLLI